MFKRKLIVYSVGCFCWLSCLMMAPAFSAGHNDSLEQAVEQVKRRTNGKILSANTVHDGQRNVHNVRVLTKKGHVKRFRVDARSGKFLNPKKGRHAPPPRRR